MPELVGNNMKNNSPDQEKSFYVLCQKLGGKFELGLP